MKKINLILMIAALFIYSSTEAQDKVREKDLKGTWKLIIDIEEEMDEAKEEMDEEDSFLGKMILNSVSGLVTGIMEEIDIYMEFRSDGEVKIIVEAFDEREIEYSEWYIDSKGRLFIEDTDRFSSDDGDYWLIDDDVLISFEDKYDRNENVYMVRIDK